MYLVSIANIRQMIISKEDLPKLLAEVTTNGLPIRDLGNGQFEAARVPREAIVVFDLSALVVDTSDIELPKTSQLIRPSNVTNMGDISGGTKN